MVLILPVEVKDLLRRGGGVAVMTAAMRRVSLPP